MAALIVAFFTPVAWSENYFNRKTLRYSPLSIKNFVNYMLIERRVYFLTVRYSPLLSAICSFYIQQAET
jgi:hypothetical protein